MRDVYVYYRIEEDGAEHAEAQIDALLASLTSHCVRARRAQRCDDPCTWMEVYEGVGALAPFIGALDRSAVAFGCAAFTRGERHVECFERAVND